MDSIVIARPLADLTRQVSVRWPEPLQNKQRFLSIRCCHSCWVSLLLESSLPERSTRRVVGFESFGLGFCSERNLECGMDFGVVDRTADAAEVDDLGKFCLFCCSRERS
jgi:hypothetical protein